ncbi:hypothetical protein BD324DRAFT_615036 [Kockovaella imperatae]|uniref:Uncharacterized protein n=1 Tax=Kockovaella imperatae TaxID=4999 RepID=A0A1Y1UP37_9TREE|nr:hypothetical protein BD324DRAFT_615036 [Kockovaella imperatae]ORX39801.1 hypothetical protein BD324DRAFT_615036 [Kockovaella imperatae]
MSSVFRRVSLSRKKKDGNDAGSNDNVLSPRSPSVRGDKPPRSRAVSEANSVANDADTTKSKRKMSLKGGRRRLSSLFSSSSLITHTSPDKSSRTPSQISSPTASGTTTPTRDIVGPSSTTRKFSNLNGKGAAPPDQLANGLEKLRLGSDKVDEHGQLIPESPSSGIVQSPLSEHDDSAVNTRREPRPERKRTPSMWSQWELAGAAEESSSDEDDDNEAFATPPDGLSEVEEEDEEVPERVDPTLDKTNVTKGAVASSSDVAGTGRSTIRRFKAVNPETRVRKRASTKLSDITSFSQDKELAKDLDICREVLTLFLTSHMKEAEEMCFDKDPEGSHLYLMSAHGIINGLKGMMTFDSNDLANALELCKTTSTVASTLRRPSDSLVSRIGGLVRSGAGLQRIKEMTPLQLHAELVYAETSLLKAMLAIVAGGDWLGLVREALNMRTAHGIYRNLQMFLEESDKNGFDEDIDMDFRSGVLLGTGTSSLMLSLLPGKVLKIAEVFGYAGDQKVALKTLMSAGGWSKDADKPAYDEKNEGLRRPVCDMILLAFHLVISTLIPVQTDVPLARNILAYNTRRYPDGIFFLYFQARLHTAQCEPELANRNLQRALDLPLEYIQLQHMCLWDYALNFMMMCNFKGALDCYAILKDESNWSRAVYTFSAAACLLELAEDGFENASVDEAEKLFKQVPHLTKKLAGKSLPIEKLANRKVRKFESQNRHLFLPATELLYVYGGISMCPRSLLLSKHLPRIDKHLSNLKDAAPEKYGNGEQYWDDYCLGHFLRGCVQLFARYQPSQASEEAREAQPGDPSDEELDRGAERDLQECLKNGPEVRLDHYILYHCHYELGRLYARRGDKVNARKNFDAVMNNKLAEPNLYEKKTKGKYSLEGALLLKTHAAIQTLENDGQV